MFFLQSMYCAVVKSWVWFVGKVVCRVCVSCSWFVMWFKTVVVPMLWIVWMVVFSSFFVVVVVVCGGVVVVVVWVGRGCGSFCLGLVCWFVCLFCLWM